MQGKMQNALKRVMTAKILERRNKEKTYSWCDCRFRASLNQKDKIRVETMLMFTIEEPTEKCELTLNMMH